MQPLSVSSATPCASARVDRALRGMSRQISRLDIDWHDVPSLARDEVEAFIRRRFSDAYDARISRFLPCLISLSDADGPCGAVGLRPAGESRLFLEQYLDQPVEQAVAGMACGPVARDSIVEIGNLGSRDAGASLLLFLTLGSVLEAAGCRWMVFSATGQVATMVEKVGLPTRTLASADPVRLTGSVDDWGSYYESAPRVMAGDVQAAFAALSLQPALAAALALISPLAHPMAEHLRRRQVTGPAAREVQS